MVTVNLITIMDLLSIKTRVETSLIGIMVKEVMKLEDLEDSVTIILKDLLIIEVVVHMILIVPQMEVLNLKEVDGPQKVQMKTGMVFLKIHLQL